MGLTEYSRLFLIFRVGEAGWFAIFQQFKRLAQHAGHQLGFLVAPGGALGRRRDALLEALEVGEEQFGLDHLGLGERIDTRVQFAFDSLGGSVRLEEATATLDSLVYSLAHPSRVSWDQRSVSIEGLEIRRDDHDHMRITADGTLSRSDVSEIGRASRRERV